MRPDPIDKPEDYTPANFVRALACAALLALALWHYGGRLGAAAGLAAGGLAFSILWLALEKAKIVYTPRAPRIVLLPTAVDIAIITYFVVMTGSVNSLLVIGYYFSIVISSQNVRSPRHGEFATLASVLAFAGSSLAVLLGALPGTNILGGPSGAEPAAAAWALSLNCAGFVALNRLTRYQVGTVKAIIGRLERSESQLKRQNGIIKLLLRDFEDHSSDWLFELDAELRLTYLPEKLASRPEGAALVGLPLREILPRLLPGDDELGEGRFAVLIAAFASGEAFEGVEIRVEFNGRCFWLEVAAAPMAPEAAGAPGVWRGVGRDVTEKKDLESRLSRRAFVDERTGLPNRNRFDLLLDEALGDGGEIGERTGILGIVKLDRLDQVRSNLATHSADDLIGAFVAKAREILGDPPSLCRLEYDEFGFWIEPRSIQDLERIHELGRSMRKPLAFGSESLFLDTRIGIAFWPDDGNDRKDLLKAADLALNSMPPQGGYRVARYSVEHSERFIRRSDLVNSFPAALAAGEFSVAYQPQVGAEGEELTGAEALARWNNPRKGAISPAEFVPLAERSGFIAELDEWVLSRACEDAAAWPRPASLSVNVSGNEAKDPRRLLNAVRASLERSGLAPGRLILEITESALLASGSEAGELLASLRELGIRIALDDFGTGYSSLSYLHELRLDELKIDYGFVRSLERGAVSRTIIKAVVEMAAGMGLETVAEGVETREQARVLKELGCRTFQGYLFGKPMTNELFVERCRGGR